MTMSDAPLSLGARLHQLAQADPDAAMISMGAVTLSRREVDARSNRLARAFQAKGLGQGDLLSIALANSVDFMVAAAACWKLGATPQPVSWRLPIAELTAIVELAQSSFVLCEPGAATGDAPGYTVDELLASTQDAAPLPDAIAPSWKAPTSGGSTGRPKLIMASTPGVYTPTFNGHWNVQPDDIAIMPGPLYHNAPFGSAALSMMRGAHMILMPKFDAEAVLKEVEERGATWLYLVPTMMNRIWRLPDEVRNRYDISKLRTVWHTAAPCPPWLKEAWLDWIGPDVIWELFGTTEAICATVISGREWLAKPRSAGVPIFGEMKIVGENGETLPAGEVGEIYARRGVGAPPSYFYRGAQTVQTEGGWETMGDMGYLDEDGYLFLADRRGDMILVGGSNVYPAEIEAVLDEHPAVGSSCVIGLPDDDMGNLIHAIVQTKGDVSAEDLHAHIASRLVSYKRPRSFELVTHALKDDAGKVRRSQLRAERIADAREKAPG
ncbi:MAG: AMP-binding protein [Phenylobacterium sp.]|uniref:AMP-binding protein n=1 Tax=Phenylobacterium sp. TaxID=1871053 RepID=UPI0027338A52|nr:AMP-binding protein [Phenylobacterium sp.]MDP3172844.1 AMP-binding protein [Phenylobacterium sp.]